MVMFSSGRKALTLTFLVLGFLVLVVHSARGPGETTAHIKDFLLVLAIFGVPFLVLLFILSASKWREMAGNSNQHPWRNRLALAGAIAGVTSAGFLVLLLPFWGFVVTHSSLGEVWVVAGGLLSIIAAVSGIFGSPDLRRPAIVSVLLLPFWWFVAALLLKATMD